MKTLSFILLIKLCKGNACDPFPCGPHQDCNDGMCTCKSGFRERNAQEDRECALIYYNCNTPCCGCNDHDAQIPQWANEGLPFLLHNRDIRPDHPWFDRPFPASEKECMVSIWPKEGCRVTIYDKNGFENKSTEYSSSLNHGTHGPDLLEEGSICCSCGGDSPLCDPVGAYNASHLTPGLICDPYQCDLCPENSICNEATNFECECDAQNGYRSKRKYISLTPRAAVAISPRLSKSIHPHALIVILKVQKTGSGK